MARLYHKIINNCGECPNFLGNISGCRIVPGMDVHHGEEPPSRCPLQRIQMASLPSEPYVMDKKIKVDVRWE